MTLHAPSFPWLDADKNSDLEDCVEAGGATSWKEPGSLHHHTEESENIHPDLGGI